MLTSSQTIPLSDAAVPAAADRGYRLDVVENIGPHWDTIVATFADACVEQSAAHMGPRWGFSRLCGLLLREGATNEPLAAMLAVTAVIPLIRLGLAYVKFGPLWRRRGRPAAPGTLVAGLNAMRQVFAVERGLVVRVMPPPDPDFAAEWQASLAAAGFHPHAPIADPERYLVDLTLSEAEQLASLSASWRANLGKARGLDIREVDVNQSLPDFLALYHTMQARKGFVDRHNIETLPALAVAAPAGLGVRLFLAFADGAPVAGSLIAGAGERVFVLASASNDRGLALRAGYAVRWAIIGWLRGTQVRWLDLGGDEADAGLRSFKRGNVGKRGRVVPLMGEFDHAGTALSGAVAAAMTFTHGLMHGPLAQRLSGRR
jgi:Acetyltransferase (GNAT) domain